MALTAYLAATNRLLQNPIPANPLYSTADLTTYINEARQQLAGDAQCIRATGTANLTAALQFYPFSLFGTFALPGVATGSITFIADPTAGDTITLNGILWTFVMGAPGAHQLTITGTLAITLDVAVNVLNAAGDGAMIVASYSDPTGSAIVITYKTPGATGNTYTLAASAATPSGATLTGGLATIPGIQGVLSIRQMSVATGSGFKLMTTRPWAWFNRYFLSTGVAQTTGVPSTWSQLGLGTKGSIGISPVATSALAVQADCVCLPVNLVDDTTAEAIPYPFTDAVPYYAAYKAYLSSQKTQDATTMLGRYKEFTKRAIEETTATVMPMNYQGGKGAQIAATKQSVTTESARQGGQ